MSSNSQEMPGCSTEEDSAPKDAPFDPSIDELIHDHDDERTLDEEEALAADEGESTNHEAELLNLEKELKMPIEEIMALYGYPYTVPQPPVGLEETVLIDSGDVVNKHSTLNLLYDSNIEDSDLPSVNLTSDDEEEGDSDVFFTTTVGPNNQADIPDFNCNHEFEDDDQDQLLWKPSDCLLDSEIEEYIEKVYHIFKENEQMLRGNEEGPLYLLSTMGYDIDKALKKVEEEGLEALKHPNYNIKDWPENKTQMESVSKDFLKATKHC
ncbi:unnamed protein product [Ceutorhynchus assimilis]|uniref:ELM2 domain-containing protein n=1 Tax=Ceutorhynchus assimilis TaxID=467358 RepID=A0A9N9QJ51_9CUCU|nr:unnamed protein product [Ceutorhynchus assimilis]